MKNKVLILFCLLINFSLKANCISDFILPELMHLPENQKTCKLFKKMEPDLLKLIKINLKDPELIAKQVKTIFQTTVQAVVVTEIEDMLRDYKNVYYFEIDKEKAWDDVLKKNGQKKLIVQYPNSFNETDKLFKEILENNKLNTNYLTVFKYYIGKHMDNLLEAFDDQINRMDTLRSALEKTQKGRLDNIEIKFETYFGETITKANKTFIKGFKLAFLHLSLASAPFRPNIKFPKFKLK